MGNPAALAAEKTGIPYLETGNPLEPFMAVKDWQYAYDFFVSGVELGDDNFQVMTDLGLKAKTNSIVATCVDNSPDGPVFDAMWTAAAKKYGWKQVKMPPYPASATEFNSLIQKVKESGADYMIALGDTPQLVALRKQMDAAGLQPKILDFARGAQLQQFADSLGTLSNGVFIESYWLPELPYPGAAEVGKRYTDDTGQSMGQILGPEYAAGQIMFDAIDRAGTTDPQKIVDAIAATTATSSAVRSSSTRSTCRPSRSSGPSGRTRSRSSCGRPTWRRARRSSRCRESEQHDAARRGDR